MWRSEAAQGLPRASRTVVHVYPAHDGADRTIVPVKVHLTPVNEAANGIRRWRGVDGGVRHVDATGGQV